MKRSNLRDRFDIIYINLWQKEVFILVGIRPPFHRVNKFKTQLRQQLGFFYLPIFTNKKRSIPNNSYLNNLCSLINIQVEETKKFLQLDIVNNL